MHIDVNDPRFRNAAAETLRRHDRGEPEANITSAVRDFLIVTDLARSEEMVEENPPPGTSRRAVDLTALDTFIEFKRRIGTSASSEPNHQYVEQLDDYLAETGSDAVRRWCCLSLNLVGLRLVAAAIVLNRIPGHELGPENRDGIDLKCRLEQVPD